MTPAGDKAAVDRARLKLARHLGEGARAARKGAELTQADVAERIGVATEVYGRMERGGLLPRLPTFRRLCRVLGVDANVLLGLTTSATDPGLDPPERLPEEPLAVRRLVRLMRAMNGRQLVALARVAQVLVDAGTHASPDAPDSPST
ncbi:helix-turn-helix transcriptional regulator [Archangium sp.]|uniref:helix-turn-helix transcriptional regulator n=1 Tax=Archangium sp. TaxID=1872627 RepID=UPI002ED87D7C